MKAPQTDVSWTMKKWTNHLDCVWSVIWVAAPFYYPESEYWRIGPAMQTTQKTQLKYGRCTRIFGSKLKDIKDVLDYEHI